MHYIILRRMLTEILFCDDACWVIIDLNGRTTYTPAMIRVGNNSVFSSPDCQTRWTNHSHIRSDGAIKQYNFTNLDMCLRKCLSIVWCVGADYVTRTSECSFHHDKTIIIKNYKKQQIRGVTQHVLDRCFLGKV